MNALEYACLGEGSFLVFTALLGTSGFSLREISHYLRETHNEGAIYQSVVMRNPDEVNDLFLLKASSYIFMVK